MKKIFYGEAVFLPPYRGRVRADCHTPLFLGAISDCQHLLTCPEAEILLDSRSRVGILNLPLDSKKTRDVVIKEFRTFGIDKLKTLFFPSKACKAWQGAWLLIEKEIGTPSPLAYLERKKKGFIQQSFFLAERIASAQEIRHLFKESPASRMELLLKSLASFLFSCHEKGIFHKDLSDGNILVEKDDRGGYRFFLLDTNHIHTRKNLGSLKRVKYLIRLGVPQVFQSYFLEKYFGARPLPGYLKTWYIFNKILYTGFVRLKKRLGLQKLARRLRIQ